MQEKLVEWTTGLNPMRTSMVSVILATALVPLAAAGACFLKPTPPVFTPQSAEILSVTPARLGVRIRFIAHNPNFYALTAQSVSARVTLAGRELGTTRVPDGVSLPARSDTSLNVDLVVPWNNLPGVIAAVAFYQNVPYHVDGTVAVGTRSLHFSVPFQVDGSIPQSTFLTAGFNSLMQVPNMPWPTIQLPAGINIPRL